MNLPTTTPESAGMSSARLARIKPALERWVDRGTISGAQALIARRGKIVYADQAGFLDRAAGTPMRDDAIYRIYSMTKPIICTALMTLYEEGAFQLHTPVAKFIPGFGTLKVQEEDGAGGQREVDLVGPVTVGQLMAHMAGLSYDFLTDWPVAEQYRQAGLLADGSRTLAQFIAELVRLPLAFQPGTRWHYSVGIDVAAHLVELMTDMPLREALRARLFEPLGMVDTDFCVPDDKLPRLAEMVGAADLGARNMTLMALLEAWMQGVNVRLDVAASYPTDQPGTFARGGAGLFSTAEDYMRFALMLAGGGACDGVRILGRKTVELMHANRVPAHLLPWEIGGFPTPGYGFGLGSRTLLDVGEAGTPGTVDEFGWAGAASTYYWVDPGEQLVGVFMTQYQGMDEPDKDVRVLAYQAIVA